MATERIIAGLGAICEVPQYQFDRYLGSGPLIATFTFQNTETNEKKQFPVQIYHRERISEGVYEVIFVDANVTKKCEYRVKGNLVLML